MQKRCSQATTLVLGIGNALLSDEGIGVHLVHYLEQHYPSPNVEYFDAGTLGLLAAYKLAEANRVFILDTVFAAGPPGTLLKFTKQEILSHPPSTPLSPHQAGIREMLLVNELRCGCVGDITLFGIVPARISPGAELSPELQQQLPRIAQTIYSEF